MKNLPKCKNYNICNNYCSYSKGTYCKSCYVEILKENNPQKGKPLSKFQKDAISKANSKYKKQLTKKFLYDMYIKKKLSSLKIAKIINCSPRTIIYNLRKFKIRIKKSSEYPSSFKGKTWNDNIRKAIIKANTGRIAWSKGLTKETNTYLKELSEKMSGAGNPIFGKKNELNPNWKNGISRLPYSKEWTKDLRQEIRERDNFTCQCCGLTEEEQITKIKRILSVHHINYDKQDCRKENLITTCCICNARANGNRDYWFAYYTYIMENYIYVKKE